MPRKPPTEGTIKALGELVVASLRSRAYTRMSVAELRTRMDTGEALTIVDCRSPLDFNDGHLPGAINLSYRTFMDEWERVPQGGPIAAICYVGMYSRAAAQKLARNGYPSVFHVVGGMRAWSEAYGDPSEEDEEDGDVYGHT